MLKEIHEQPKGIFEDAATEGLNDDGSINLDGISMTKGGYREISTKYISWHAVQRTMQVLSERW